MATELVVPELGESVVEATIAVWHKQVGDAVSAGDIVVELETDKVNLDVESPVDGVLASIAFEEGTDVNIGDVLAVINEGAGGGTAASAPESAQAAPAVASASAPAAQEGGRPPWRGGWLRRKG